MSKQTNKQGRVDLLTRAEATAARVAVATPAVCHGRNVVVYVCTIELGCHTTQMRKCDELNPL